MCSFHPKNRRVGLVTKLPIHVRYNTPLPHMHVCCAHCCSKPRQTFVSYLRSNTDTPAAKNVFLCLIVFRKALNDKHTSKLC